MYPSAPCSATLWNYAGPGGLTEQDAIDRYSLHLNFNCQHLEVRYQCI